MIKVTEKYGVKSDTNQWILCKSNGVDKRTGEERWDPVKYYHDLDYLCESLIGILTREGEYESMNELKSLLSYNHTLTHSKLGELR